MGLFACILSCMVIAWVINPTWAMALYRYARSNWAATFKSDESKE